MNINIEKKDGEEVVVLPLKVEFHPKDVLQVIIGASILAIPVAYTEEIWKLGTTLPLLNAMAFMVISLLFVGAFTYYNYYRHNINVHMDKFVKRTFSTYILAFIVVAIVLTLIQKAPWTTNFLQAFKTAVIATFPASMSGAIADTLH